MLFIKFTLPRLWLAGLLISLGLSFALSANASWVSDLLGDEFIPIGCREGCQPGPDGQCPPNLPTTTAGQCGVKEIILIIVNVSRLILGLLGSVALLMFVLGGLMLIIAAGNRERVEKGKTILTNAVIGILIVFSSWVIINFITVALTRGDKDLGAPAQVNVSGTLLNLGEYPKK